MAKFMRDYCPPRDQISSDVSNGGGRSLHATTKVLSKVVFISFQRAVTSGRDHVRPNQRLRSLLQAEGVVHRQPHLPVPLPRHLRHPHRQLRHHDDVQPLRGASHSGRYNVHCEFNPETGLIMYHTLDIMESF